MCGSSDTFGRMGGGNEQHREEREKIIDNVFYDFIVFSDLVLVGVVVFSDLVKVLGRSCRTL